MAITFDPVTQIIALDSFSVSASEIWSRWVDWLITSDNAKYPPAFSQIGGVAPIALYLYLENGWRVRPQEADGQTIITGNLLVQGGGNPIVKTAGNFSSQVFLETPVSAQAIEVDGGGGGSGASAAEVWAYADRTLSEAAGVTAQNITDIITGVWAHATRTLTGTVGLSPVQETQLKELWQLQGLDPTQPMTVTQTNRIVDAITILFTGDGVTSTTTTRQP